MKNVDALFFELGLNLTTAFNIFLRQSVREQQIPFQVVKNVPNAVILPQWIHPKRKRIYMDLMTTFPIYWRYAMLKIVFTSQFKKDYKLAAKRCCEPKKPEYAITLLANELLLPEQYKDHALTNSLNHKDMRKCQIEPDRFIVYMVLKETLILRLIRRSFL